MISIREITNLQELADYRDIWNELNAECADSTIFTSFEWVYSWYNWYSFSGHPLVLFAYSEKKPIGFAPLYAWKGTLGKVSVKRIDFAGYNFGIGNFIVSNRIDEVVAAMMDYLTRQKWDVMVLKGIPKDSDQFSGLAEWLEERNYRSITEPHDIRIIKFEETWDEYLKRFGQKLRHTFNNKRNQVQKLYNVEFKRLSTISQDDLPSYMDAIVDIANKSWKAETGSAIGSNAHVEGFYRQIAQEFNRKGELDLSLLYFDGKPVAYLFGLTVANQYHAIDTAYLDEFKKNSPGTLVNLYLLQDLFDDHCVRYVNEGYDPYKSRYIADVWDTFQVFLFSNSVRAKLAYAAKFKLQPLLEQSQNGENS